MLMLTSGNVKDNTEPLVFSILSLHPFLKFFGHWKRLDAVDVHQISCLSNCPWWIFSVLRKTLNFEKVPMIMRVWPTPGTNHSTPLKAALPSDPPLPCTCPLTRSLTSLGSTAANVVQKNTFYVTLPFQAWKRRIHYALFWLISKKMSAILFRLFVRSFFYLPYCSYETYRWVDECIVLLLLTCLRLYGFAVSMFGGGRDGVDRIPGLKKKKIRSILYTM